MALLTTADAVYLGGAVDAVYFGSTLVWEATPGPAGVLLGSWYFDTNTDSLREPDPGHMASRAAAVGFGHIYVQDFDHLGTPTRESMLYLEGPTEEGGFTLQFSSAQQGLSPVWVNEGLGTARSGYLILSTRTTGEPLRQWVESHSADDLISIYDMTP